VSQGSAGWLGSPGSFGID